MPAEKKEKRVDWRRELAEMQGPSRVILEAGTRTSPHQNRQAGMLGGGGTPKARGGWLAEMDANLKRRVEEARKRRKRAGGLAGLFGSGRGH